MSLPIFLSDVKGLLLDSQLLGYVFGNGVLVDKNVHGLVCHECFGGIPYTIVLVSSNTGTQREITCAVITKYYALSEQNVMRTVRT